MVSNNFIWVMSGVCWYVKLKSQYQDLKSQMALSLVLHVQWWQWINLYISVHLYPKVRESLHWFMCYCTVALASILQLFIWMTASNKDNEKAYNWRSSFLSVQLCCHVTWLRTSHHLSATLHCLLAAFSLRWSFSGISICVQISCLVFRYNLLYFFVFLLSM